MGSRYDIEETERAELIDMTAMSLTYQEQRIVKEIIDADDSEERTRRSLGTRSKSYNDDLGKAFRKVLNSTFCETVDGLRLSYSEKMAMTAVNKAILTGNVDAMIKIQKMAEKNQPKKVDYGTVKGNEVVFALSGGDDTNEY